MTNPQDPKPAREWTLAYCHQDDSATVVRGPDVFEDTSVVDAHWRSMAIELAERLQAILECPCIVDKATVPKAGIESAPPYQVVFTLCTAHTKLLLGGKALANFNKLKGGE
jgi:hypothetical protein